jgi:hypothetical protein
LIKGDTCFYFPQATLSSPPSLSYVPAPGPIAWHSARNCFNILFHFVQGDSRTAAFCRKKFNQRVINESPGLTSETVIAWVGP